MARRSLFTVLGKNPTVRGSHAPTFSEEWRSVRGLHEGLRVRPTKIGSDEQGHLLWRTSLGEMWTPAGAGEDYVGRLAAEMYANVYTLVGSDKVLLDCGANVGFFSRYAFQRGAEKVIAFEPSPGNAACLRKNLAPELADGRFVLIEKGVWEKETTLSFSTRNINNPGGHHLCTDGEGDIKVQVTSIDQVVEQLGLTKLDYIKMDVEGAEVKGLRGAERTILSMRPRLCVATEHTGDLFANALEVIDSVQRMDAGYEYLVAESHGYRSPSRGKVLTPFSILFRPAGPRPVHPAPAEVQRTS
jgi:FkbM family methyltransferase